MKTAVVSAILGMVLVGQQEPPSLGALGTAGKSLAESGKAVVVSDLPGSAKAKIVKADSTIALPTGGTRAALFKLPRFSKPYDLTVHSMCNCFGFSKSIFVPSATLFDADFRETKTLSEVDFQPNNGNGFRISAVVPMTEERQGDAFLMVYTIGDRVGEKGGSLGDPRQGLAGVVFKMPYSRADQGTIEVRITAPKAGRDAR